MAAPQARMRPREDEGEGDPVVVTGVEPHVAALHPRQRPGHVKPDADARPAFGVAAAKIALEYGIALGRAGNAAAIADRAFDPVALCRDRDTDHRSGR